MNWNEVPQPTFQPDFSNLLAVLRCEVPSRPTLFEFFLNERLFSRVAGGKEPLSPLLRMRRTVTTFNRLGYDATPVLVPGFRFTEVEVRPKIKTVSLNEGAIINSRQELDSFNWPDPNDANYKILDLIGVDLPSGMKLIPYGPDGVLECVINLMGIEGLCRNIILDPNLVEDVFYEVGTRLLRYYENAADFRSVGACIVNDDWGFETGTLLSPPDMRRLLFPWQKSIVDIVHTAGKPVILHSCGQLNEVSEEIIEDLSFDGWHSYEDKILPVEDAYEKYQARIAVIGGIDLDFLCRSRPEEVYRRSRSLLERTADRGGYALGTGNSVPEYVPDSNYFAMLKAAFDFSGLPAA